MTIIKPHTDMQTTTVTKQEQLLPLKPVTLDQIIEYQRSQAQMRDRYSSSWLDTAVDALKRTYAAMKNSVPLEMLHESERDYVNGKAPEPKLDNSDDFGWLKQSRGGR